MLPMSSSMVAIRMCHRSQDHRWALGSAELEVRPRSYSGAQEIHPVGLKGSSLAVKGGRVCAPLRNQRNIVNSRNCRNSRFSCQGITTFSILFHFIVNQQEVSSINLQSACINLAFFEIKHFTYKNTIRPKGAI